MMVNDGINYNLVGGIPTPLKKIFWDDDIPNIWKNKTCSKPPTGKEYQNIMGISCRSQNIMRIAWGYCRDIMGIY